MSVQLQLALLYLLSSLRNCIYYSFRTKTNGMHMTSELVRILEQFTTKQTAYAGR
jgi:hypothetical protein